jgi:hypothetical protein
MTSRGASSRFVHSKLDAIRRALVTYHRFRWTIGLMLLAIVWAWVVGAADYSRELSFGLRTLGLAGLLAAVATIAWRVQRSLREWNEMEAATAVERTYPEFGQGLRTAQQYATDPDHAVPAASHLVTRLVHDMRQRMQYVELGEVVPWGRLALPVVSLLIALLVTFLTIAWVPESRITAARILLGPLHYTNVLVEPQDDPVPQSTDVSIGAEIQGRPLAHPLELWVRPVGEASWEPITMLPADRSAADDAETERPSVAQNANKATIDDAAGKANPPHVHGRQVATIVSPQSDLEYRVVGGPVDSAIYRLRVLPPLAQENLEARITPPAYTGRPLETSTSHDLTVVEGSQLAWELVLSREPAAVRLHPVGGAKVPHDVAAMPAAQIDGSRVRWNWDAIDRGQHFEVVATAADGMEFRSEPIQVRVRKDRVPTFAFRRPAETLEVTPTTEVKLELEVQDDFGLSHVGIEYDLGDGERHVLWQETIAGDSQRTISSTLLLEEHALNFDDSVTYYAFAQDNRPSGTRSTSELRFIDVRPYKREYEIRDGQCQGGGGGCLTLEELIARQRHTLNLTFVNQDSHPNDKRLLDRLARSQQEILTATEEFTSGWEAKFGPEPALHRALEAMRSSLETVELSDLPATARHQTTAVAALVKARKNLRQYVKNCSSSGQSACVSFDQQMAQRLRRPSTEGDQMASQQSAAQVQQQLEQLAQNQRQWSEQVAPPDGERGAQLTPPKEPAELLAAQQAARRQAESLQRTLQTDPRASEAALQRMEKLVAQIEESSEQYAESQDPGDQDVAQSQSKQHAAEIAKRAATQADSLRDHLMGLMAADMAERLSRADQIAQQIANGQQALAQQVDADAASRKSMDPPLLAQQQADLAEDATTLDDLLKHLEADSSIDAPEISRDFQELRELYPPTQLIQQMKQTEQALRRQEIVSAASGSRRAADQSRLLAEQVRELHRQVLQPKLDELLGAESKAAELLAALEAGGNEAKLAAQLPALAARAAALDITWQPTSQGFGTTQLQDASQLRTLVQSLQSKIQEVMLLRAEMDADQPVPPQYRPLVDEYYRAISDDLR